MTARQGIACAGNWIVDIVHSIDGWPRKSDLVHIRAETTGVGGGAANMALDLAAFATGLPVFPVGLVGRDLHGQTVLAALTARMRDEIVLQHAFVAIRDMTQFAQSDDRFHGLIAESAGCAAVLPELTRV